MKTMKWFLLSLTGIIFTGCGAGVNDEAVEEHQSFEAVQEEHWPFEKLNEFNRLIASDAEQTELTEKHQEMTGLVNQAYEAMQEEHYETEEMIQVHGLYLDSLRSLDRSLGELEGELEDNLPDESLQAFLNHQEDSVRYMLESHVKARQDIYGDDEAEAEANELLNRFEGNN
ncbi:hypothetical protein CR205_14200 [Alteribacter lacisalsi]|uniref:Lipoprotein n=1 Tax=Alteribacter lacisalsi TaxID=2045244 RepID=A0A2W0H6T0_9BACI|nr:hypothetical protein [Alteribacter lacisalsi]PYZ96827.1 hypothetical protein CR205_14200 [Alteribacter lacisalsi]